MSLPEKEAFRQSLLNTLKALEQAFEVTRAKTPPKYPLDEATGAVKLPHDVVVELKRLIGSRKRIEAVQLVTQLTGAGLRVSKDYVDALAAKTLTADNIFGRK
jgi:ribosomal protein L7/L12